MIYKFMIVSSPPHNLTEPLLSAVSPPFSLSLFRIFAVSGINLTQPAGTPSPPMPYHLNISACSQRRSPELSTAADQLAFRPSDRVIYRELAFCGTTYSTVSLIEAPNRKKVEMQNQFLRFSFFSEFVYIRKSQNFLIF